MTRTERDDIEAALRRALIKVKEQQGAWAMMIRLVKLVIRVIAIAALPGLALFVGWSILGTDGFIRFLGGWAVVCLAVVITGSVIMWAFGAFEECDHEAKR